MKPKPIMTCTRFCFELWLAHCAFFCVSAVIGQSIYFGLDLWRRIESRSKRSVWLLRKICHLFRKLPKITDISSKLVRIKVKQTLPIRHIPTDKPENQRMTKEFRCFQKMTQKYFNYKSTNVGPLNIFYSSVDASAAMSPLSVFFY